MRGQIKVMLALTTILCVTLAFTATMLLAHGSPSPTLYVDPPSIENPTIMPNDTITIQIGITEVTNMKVCEFNLTFSPSILQIIRVTKLKIQGQYPRLTMDISDSAGYAWVNMSYNPAVTIATNTSLVEIEFFVKGFGSTPLHFEDSTLRDSPDDIPHGTQDGFVRIFTRNVAVIDIYVTYSETYVGRVIPINVTVLNEGDIPETFTVSLYYDTTLVDTEPVIDLPPKENTTLTFDWDTGGVPASLTPYTIKAESSALPNEANLTDNTLVDGTVKLKILGDVNGDGIVDINDLTAWDAAYLTHFGDLHWNEQADINYDGVVDKADGQIIIDHYRETV